MLALVGSILCPDKSGTDVRLFVLPLLRDLEAINTFSWGNDFLVCLYHGLCRPIPLPAARLQPLYPLTGTRNALLAMIFFFCEFL